MLESDFQTFDAVGVLVLVLDPDGRIIYWNRCCSDLTGYALEEVRGRELWELVLLPEEVESVRAVFATLRTGALPSAFANHWVTKTGTRRWLAWLHTVTKRPDGRIQYIVKTGIDRTERKQAEDALRAAEAQLGAVAAENARLLESARRVSDDLREVNQHMVSSTIQAQEATEEAEVARARAEAGERELLAVAEFRERFIGIVGHDLRNPLGAINLAAETLLRLAPLNEQQEKAIGRIMSSSERMNGMIRELLDFTRARLGGGFPLKPRPTDLREVCSHVVEEFEAPIQLELEGDVAGNWDPDRLTEALSNIARNAVEHAWSGTAVVVRAHGEGDEVVVEIVNEGDPIPAEVLRFIFEPFRQAEHDRSATGNLGLGLYIAKEIVAAGGGTIDAHSTDGSTPFVMRLPRDAGSANATTCLTEGHV